MHVAELDDNQRALLRGTCEICRDPECPELSPGVCQVCRQPECPESRSPGRRPAPGAIPARLERGQRRYRGDGEWVVHPEEAVFVLHRGYALVNGERKRVTFIHNEAFVTQIAVEGTAPPREGFVDCALYP